MADQPSLEMIAKLVTQFPEQYRNEFTSQVQNFYGQYLAIMSEPERDRINQFSERTMRNQQRGQRAANTRRQRNQQFDEMFMENDPRPSIRQQLEFYSQEEFLESGIRRKFEGMDEAFIRARIQENEAKREELRRGL
jgi:hypothetical protein